MILYLGSPLYFDSSTNNNSTLPDYLEDVAEPILRTTRHHIAPNLVGDSFFLW
jgi:hypothetical protein